MARSRATKKNNKSAKTSKISPAIAGEITALGLVAAAILLLVGFFNAGGALTEWLLDGMRLLVGKSAYIIPAILLYVAVRLFMSVKEEDEEHKGLSGVSYIGLGLIVISVAGLFHIGIEPTNALTEAQAGSGGGLVGYLLNSVLLALLNVFTASVVLITIGLVGFVLALNVRLSDLIKAIIAKLRPGADEDDFSKQLGGTEVSTSHAPIINAKVPLETGRGGDDISSKEEPVVLTSVTDPDWTLPPLDLLEEATGKADAGNPEENAEIIERTLANFNIKVSMEEVNIGPTVTQYTLKPEGSVKLSKITELGNNLELSLAAHPIRIEAPIPGKSAVGVEIPNKKAAVVRLRDIFEGDEWSKKQNPLGMVLGRDIAGQAIVADLANMPHLLVAGATGSGKSIMINALLMSLLFRNSPADLRLILVDPKRVELSLYNDIPHLLSPVITEPEKCISALKWAVEEMERRYRVFAELGKRNIGEYNSVKNGEHMPYIVVVIDELADLMMMAPRDVEGLIVRIAQKARATGIHLVVATQRPSVNVITGLIKANVPARIAFSTVSQVDSRTIIDQAGAEKLIGKGDMLYMAPDHSKTRRIQGAFVSEKEVKNVTNFLHEARAPEYNEEVLTQQVSLGGSKGVGDIDAGEDSLLMDAAQIVIESRKASASLLQRRLRVGYARAARMLDMLEEQGIVSAPDGSRPRDVLVSSLSEISGNDEPEEA